MSDPTKLGLRILGAALILGVAGDGLLRALPWGLNFVLWMSGLLAALLFLGRARKEALHGGGAWLLAAGILFSAAFVWHDSTELKLLNLLAILIALALIVLRAQGGRLWPAGIMEYVGAGIVTAINAALGPLLVLFNCIQWKEIGNRQALRRSAAVAGGLLIALPLLLLFGGLLVAADAVFRGILANLLHLISWNVFTHLFLIGFFAWIVAGFLRGFLMGSELGLAAGRQLSFPRLGIVETAVVLGSLDLLFCSFVLVQVRYLFGGAPLVGITPGLTYAEYARSGFFELVAVAALALPLLLFAHWLLRQDNPLHGRVFAGLAGLQILLLFVIMASAFQRMRLYQGEFGLTEERLYPTAFMGWLAAVFVWFALTVLRGRRERFAWGALVAGFLLIAVLQVVNPDYLIARTNTARARAGRRFDARYVSSLSADATPVLLDALPALSPHDRCAVADRLLRERAPQDRLNWPDWRTWSWSRRSALQAVSSNWQTLLEARSKQKKQDGSSSCPQ